MNRETIEIGPAKWTHGALASMYTKGDASVTFDSERFAIDGAMTGHIDDRILGNKVTVSFQPDGRVNAALISALWPHLTRQRGASLLSASAATALVALPLDSTVTNKRKHIIHDAAMTKMPDLILGSNKDMVGSLEYVGVPAYNKSPGATSSLYSSEQAADFAVDSTFVKTDFHQGTYVLNWGSGGSLLADIESDDGWTLSFNMATQIVNVAGTARDIRLTSLSAMVSGTPLASCATLANKMGVAGEVSGFATPGAGVDTVGDILTVSGGGVTVSLAKAMMVSAGYRFGSSVIRQGQVGFVAFPQFTAGAIDASWCAISIA